MVYKTTKYLKKLFFLKRDCDTFLFSTNDLSVEPLTGDRKVRVHKDFVPFSQASSIIYGDAVTVTMSDDNYVTHKRMMAKAVDKTYNQSRNGDHRFNRPPYYLIEDDADARYFGIPIGTEYYYLTVGESPSLLDRVIFSCGVGTENMTGLILNKSDDNQYFTVIRMRYKEDGSGETTRHESYQRWDKMHRSRIKYIIIQKDKDVEN